MPAQTSCNSVQFNRSDRQVIGSSSMYQPGMEEGSGDKPEEILIQRIL
jgi:hypothetical protein